MKLQNEEKRKENKEIEIFVLKELIRRDYQAFQISKETEQLLKETLWYSLLIFRY